jgi:PTS system ascorbate-specific IIA component
MSAGVLLLGHGSLADAVLAGARAVLGQLPLETRALGLGSDENAGQFALRAAQAARALERGEGVLVLTDLYGATPNNAYERLRHEGIALRRVSGLNLPMLLRVYNYPELPLEELARTAAAGGRNGVIEGDA